MIDPRKMDITFGEISVPNRIQTPTFSAKNSANARSKDTNSSATSSIQLMTFPLENMQIIVPKSRRGKKTTSRITHDNPSVFAPKQPKVKENGSYNQLQRQQTQTQTQTQTQIRPQSQQKTPHSGMFDSCYRPSTFLEKKSFSPLITTNTNTIELAQPPPLRYYNSSSVFPSNLTSTLLERSRYPISSTTTRSSNHWQYAFPSGFRSSNSEYTPVQPSESLDPYKLFYSNKRALFLVAMAIILGYAVVYLANQGLALKKDVMVQREIKAQIVDNRYHTYDVEEDDGNGVGFGGAVGMVHPRQGYAVPNTNSKPWVQKYKQRAKEQGWCLKI